jgi:hypothetical protein
LAISTGAHVLRICHLLDCSHFHPRRLVEQYTKILVPSKEMLERIERRAGGPADDPLGDAAARGRREVLADAQQRVEWEKWESSRRKEEEDKAEAERIAFAEIDWQDFQVASTIEFTENDEAGIAELPPPMSLAEVENMSIAQKKMASMIMEGNGAAANGDGSDEGEMDMEDEDDDAAAAGQPVIEQRKEDVVEIQTADSSAPVKIRKDYVRSTFTSSINGLFFMNTDSKQPYSQEDQADASLHYLRGSADPGRRVWQAHPVRDARPAVEGREEASGPQPRRVCRHARRHRRVCLDPCHRRAPPRHLW